MKYTIYYIENIINNKLYIGYTSNTIEKRFKSHLKNAKNKVNRRLYDSMNYHGYENFKVIKLDETDTQEMANELESWYIYLLDTINPDKGYNMTLGGDGGNTLIKYSDEEKQLIYQKQQESREKTMLKKYGVKSAAMLDFVKEKISKAHHGKSISEVHKKSISNTLKQKIKSDEFVPNTDGLRPHKVGEFKHSHETKVKLSKARNGKTYEDLFDEKKSNELKELHRKMWSGKNNPNYVENITDDELCYIINCLIYNKTIGSISKDIGKSSYKIKQRLVKEGLGNIQKLKREDKENKVLIKLLKKYEK